MREGYVDQKNKQKGTQMYISQDGIALWNVWQKISWTRRYIAVQTKVQREVDYRKDRQMQRELIKRLWIQMRMPKDLG